MTNWRSKYRSVQQDAHILQSPSGLDAQPYLGNALTIPTDSVAKGAGSFTKPARTPKPRRARRRLGGPAREFEVYRLFYDQNDPTRLFTDDIELADFDPANVNSTSTLNAQRVVQALSHFRYLDPTSGDAFVVWSLTAATTPNPVDVILNESKLDTVLTADVGNTPDTQYIGWGFQDGPKGVFHKDTEAQGQGPFSGTITPSDSGSSPAQVIEGVYVTTFPSPIGFCGAHTPTYGALGVFELLAGPQPARLLVSYTPGSFSGSDFGDGTFLGPSRTVVVDNENRTDATHTHSASGFCSLAAFCNPANTFTYSGSTSLSYTLDLDDIKTDVGESPIHLLEIDALNSYNRTDTGVSYTASTNREEDGTSTYTRSVGSTTTSVPPKPTTSFFTFPSWSLTLDYEQNSLINTYVTTPIIFDLDIPGINDNFFFSAAGSSSSTFEVDVTMTRNIANQATSTSTLLPASGGSDRDSVLAEGGTYTVNSISASGSIPSHSWELDVPIMVLDVDGDPLYFFVERSFTAAGSTAYTTDANPDIQLNTDQTTGCVGSMFPWIVGTTTTSIGLSIETSMWVGNGRDSGWSPDSVLRDHDIFPSIELIVDSGTNQAGGSVTITQTTTADDWTFKLGDTTIPQDQSFFILNPPSATAGLNIGATTITLTRPPGSATMELISVRGIEPRLLDASCTITRTATAGGGISTVNLLSGTANPITSGLTGLPWYVCVRNVNAPDDVTYTLYSCTLSSFVATPLTSGNSLEYWFDGSSGSEDNRCIQFDSMQFTINSQTELDHFPVPEAYETGLRETINSFTSTGEVLITTQNLLAVAMFLRDFVTVLPGGSTWYLTNRQSDGVVSDSITGNTNDVPMFGSQLSFDTATGQLTFVDNISYTAPAAYTRGDDQFWLLSKKIQLG